MASLGKSLMVLGLLVALVGTALWGLGGLPLIGRLPGDIYVRRASFSFYFPLTTCILLSILLTLVLMLFRR